MWETTIQLWPEMALVVQKLETSYNLPSILAVPVPGLNFLSTLPGT